MVNHRYKRAVLGITTALVVSACTVPAMAAPITINTDQSISVVSTDSTYVGGLDLEARIITTVEQDQRSPYAKKGIAVADDYLKIHTEPNGDADVVGKLYSGSGCEIEEVKDGWAHITSGDCDGYVEACDIPEAAGAGLIPEKLAERVHILGNAVIAGLCMYIQRPDQEGIRRMIQHTREISLAKQPKFTKTFLDFSCF